MRGLIHKFLIYAPAAIGGLVISASGVWDGLRDRIALAASQTVSAMQHPGIAIGAGILLIAYVVAIVITDQGGAEEAEARARAKAELNRRRGHIVTVGRALAHGFLRVNDERTLFEFMQADGGYARIRRHFTRKFTARLHSAVVDQDELARALLDEMDRLERKWKLV